jgi:mRNA-degrading endonuclease toxin of MazEF toxin-antitoxin module
LKPFDIFFFQPPGPLWKEPHPAVVVSHPDRAERKEVVEIIVGSTVRASRPPAANEFLLDTAEGLDWPTLFKCDLIYAALKMELKQRRGSVSPERRSGLVRKLIAAHGWSEVLARG